MFAPDERLTELALLFFTAIAPRNDDKSPLVQNRILATKVESTVDPRKAVTQPTIKVSIEMIGTTFRLICCGLATREVSRQRAGRNSVVIVSPIKLMRAARFCQKLSSDLAMFANGSVTIPG